MILLMKISKTGETIPQLLKTCIYKKIGMYVKVPVIKMHSLFRVHLKC